MTGVNKTPNLSVYKNFYDNNDNNDDEDDDGEEFY